MILYELGSGKVSSWLAVPSLPVLEVTGNSEHVSLVVIDALWVRPLLTLIIKNFKLLRILNLKIAVSEGWFAIIINISRRDYWLLQTVRRRHWELPWHAGEGGS